jgi:OH-DDVA meta-cleavage compound hydrolase
LCSWRGEIFGATNAVDPQTGRNVEDTVPLLQSIDWLSDADRSQLTKGNARQVSSQMQVGASG